MTVKERIEASQVYSFYVRNAKIESKKVRCINKVCEYLKSNCTILCDDKLLREVVTKVYEKIAYYERMEYDFSDIHPCCRPWYHRHFQVRMHGDSDLPTTNSPTPLMCDFFVSHIFIFFHIILQFYNGIYLDAGLEFYGRF